MGRARDSRGFTLVEVLLALLLIALGVLAAAPMFMYALRGNAAGADLGTAGALAVERMELLRMTDHGSLVDGGSLTANVAGYSDTSTPGFDVRWEVSTGGGPGSVKTVTVRVVSTRVNVGASKQVTLATLRAR